MELAIQAIIMAGGEGVRLRPLTMEKPKPLVPLLGEPVMGYALKLLKIHGVHDVGVTLWYQPKKIRAAFGRGEAWGVKLRYYEETVPLGTAGSVRMAKDQIKDPFFVLSGDGLTDCDLTKAMAFHRAKGALATLVLKRVSVPLPYGVVLTDGENRITRFIEKPGWSRVYSDLVNTGIYLLDPAIFDHIPENGMPDFGKDIFPSLVQQGLPVYGFETDGYWCDVGDQRAYLAAQMALLQGQVSLPHPEGIQKNARVDASVQCIGPCFVGAGAAIGPGAVLRHAVIGEQCTVGAGARIENTCLWTGAAVMEKAQATGSVLCDGAVARPGAVIRDGCALGNGAVAGAWSMLRPGVKVWPHLRVAPGAVVTYSLTHGDFTAPSWTEWGADCDDPEQACALCAAYARVTGARQVLLGGTEASALLALAGGALAAAGMKVLSAGELTEPMLQALVRSLRLDGGVFVRGQMLCFLDKNGQKLSFKQRTAMDGCILRRDGTPAFTRPGSVIRLTGAEGMYLARILPEENPRPLWSPLAVFSDSPLILRLAKEGLERMNARHVRFGAVREAELSGPETGFVLDAEGTACTVFSGACSPDREQSTLLLLSLCRKWQGKLFDLPGVPRAAERMAPFQESDGGEACAWQRMMLEDGLAGMLLIADALKAGALETLLQELPETHILKTEVDCLPRDKGRILHTLCDSTSLPHTLGEGVRIQHEKGVATIVPDAYRNAVRITGESVSSEFARELCDFYLDKIKRIASGDAKSTNIS